MHRTMLICLVFNNDNSAKGEDPFLPFHCIQTNGAAISIQSMVGADVRETFLGKSYLDTNNKIKAWCQLLVVSECSKKVESLTLNNMCQNSDGYDQLY